MCLSVIGCFRLFSVVFGTFKAVFKFCGFALRCVKICSKLRSVVSTCFRMLEDVQFVLVVSRCVTFFSVVPDAEKLSKVVQVVLGVSGCFLNYV